MKATWITRDLAAEALDLTVDYDSRGPRTAMARTAVAEWLDLGGTVTHKIRIAVLWLRSLSR